MYWPGIPQQPIAWAVYPTQQTKFAHFAHIVNLQYSYGGQHGLCMLKYFDEDFFGQVDPQLRYFLMDSHNASDPILFSQKTNDLMSKLAEIAHVTPKMYAKIEHDKAWRVRDTACS